MQLQRLVVNDANNDESDMCVAVAETLHTETTAFESLLIRPWVLLKYGMPVILYGT